MWNQCSVNVIIWHHLLEVSSNCPISLVHLVTLHSSPSSTILWWWVQWYWPGASSWYLLSGSNLLTGTKQRFDFLVVTRLKRVVLGSIDIEVYRLGTFAVAGSILTCISMRLGCFVPAVYGISPPLNLASLDIACTEKNQQQTNNL